MYRIIGGDGNEYGPLTADQVGQWLAQGRADRQTKVRRDDATEWQPLGSMAEFAGVSGPPPKLPPQPSDGAISKIIPYRNAPALAGYYCGVFAVIPILGIVLGFVALVLGVIGLRVARQNPAAGGKIHAWVAIILGGLCGFGYLGLILALIGAASR